MPAWIWMPQILAFSHRYHVVAFDPRGQGDSAVPATGYEPVRRGRDIAELIAHLDPPPVVVVGWSLGVLDTLASVHVAGRSPSGRPGAGGQLGRRGAAAVLSARAAAHAARRPTTKRRCRQFVRAMFHRRRHRPIWTA